jgi:hypothetical protein
MTTAAHAGEPWPENVCNTLTGYEQRDVKRYTDPLTLAYARTNVLHMLKAHCGVETAETINADMAVRKGAAASGGGGGGWSGGGGIDPDGLVEISPSRKPSTHCTSFPLGGGMAAIDCD